MFLFCCEKATDYHSDANKCVDDKRYEQALISINKAIQLEPDSVDHFTLRMMIFDLTGRYEEEILDLNRIIELNGKRNSKSITAHRQRAWAQTQLGLYTKALSDINYVIEKRDTFGSLADALLIKAGILWKLNESDSSKHFYELTIKESSGKEKLVESDALVGLANLTQSPKAAIELLNKAIVVNDKNGHAYGARMERYMNLGEIDKAYDDSKTAMHLNPSDATVNYNIGQLFANNLNNNDSAVKYLEKAIKLAPQSSSNGSIYINLAVIRQRSGKLDEALIDFQNAEAIDSKDDLLLYNFALLLSDLGKNTEALEKISTAININSKDADYFNLKGSILLSQSLYDEAEKEFKKAIEINPKFGSGFYNLGYLFGEQKEYEKSIEYYDKAVLLNFDLQATLVNRALQKIRINKTLSACTDLDRAYKLGRKDIKPLIEKNCK